MKECESVLPRASASARVNGGVVVHTIEAQHLNAVFDERTRALPLLRPSERAEHH